MNITKDIEAYQYVKEMLLQQNEKSLDADRCSYRGYSEKLFNEIAQSMFKLDYEELGSCSDNQMDSFYEELYSRKPDLRCAVGFLIQDKFYSNGLEENSIDERMVVDRVERSNPNWVMGDSSIKMLKELQIIHDSKDPIKWPSLLEEFKFDQDGNYLVKTIFKNDKEENND